jgi:hypothetical protein
MTWPQRISGGHDYGFAELDLFVNPIPLHPITRVCWKTVGCVTEQSR